MGNRLDRMKGGGFLNNVDALFVDYAWSATFPGEASADPDDPQLFYIITVLQDGNTDPVQTTLRAGSRQFLEIVDPHTIRNIDGNEARIWDKSDLYHFLKSVAGAGVPDGGIDADTDISELKTTSLIGRRMRFTQEKDADRMAARAKAGQNPKRVVTKDGVSKEYDYTRLVVETAYDGVHATPTAKPAVGRSTTAKAAPAKTTAGVARATSAAPTGTVDIDGESKRVLTEVLKANGNAVNRSQLSMLITKGYTGHPQREAIRKRVFSEDFLKTEQGWTFDESGKNQMVSLNG